MRKSQHYLIYKVLCSLELLKGPLDGMLCITEGIMPETASCKVARPKRQALYSGDLHPAGLLKESVRVNRWVVAY